jgi:hypothetical protein
MIEIEFEGTGEDLAKVHAAAERTNLLRSAEEGRGFEGAEIIKLVLNDGPQVVTLLTSIVGLITAGVKLKMVIDNKPDKPSKPPE